MERRLTAAQRAEIRRRIVAKFYRWGEGGAQYGVDWPTARLLWPRTCRVYTRLVAAGRL